MIPRLHQSLKEKQLDNTTVPTIGRKTSCPKKLIQSWLEKRAYTKDYSIFRRKATVQTIII